MLGSLRRRNKETRGGLFPTGAEIQTFLERLWHHRNTYLLAEKACVRCRLELVCGSGLWGGGKIHRRRRVVWSWPQGVAFLMGLKLGGSCV